MNPENDGTRFGKLMGLLAITFDKEASDAMISAYWMALSDCNIHDIEQSVQQAMRKCDFMPKPAEIRKFIGGGTDEDVAIAAWLDVVQAMPLGAYKSICFRDPIINATIRSLGGWPALFDKCGSSQDESFYRHAFLKTYASLANSRLSGESTMSLSGIAEITVVDKQVVPVKPLFIGAVRKPVSIDKQEPKQSSHRLEFAKP
jgi:hypothetical protein